MSFEKEAQHDSNNRKRPTGSTGRKNVSDWPVLNETDRLSSTPDWFWQEFSVTFHTTRKIHAVTNSLSWR